MEIGKKEEILKLIDESLENGGNGYINNHPEDDIESRRDWDCLHSDWCNLYYGLEEIRDLIKNM